jgi:PHD/YefM family antitoxin component YafN of YafNO toxin-antitoxin module
MAVYNYGEARQKFSAVFNTALKEDVIIKRRDGSKFKLISINENKMNQDKRISPLENIKGIKTNITMKEILDAIKHGRRG